MQAIDASENVDFNLHTYVECNSPLLPDSKTIVISTHALTWSATGALYGAPRPPINFNSRTHVECDIGIFVVDGDGYIISTHVECDRMNDKKHNASNNFNSRTHVECDRLCLRFPRMNGISTHALTWSATEKTCRGWF